LAQRASRSMTRKLKKVIRRLKRIFEACAQLKTPGKARFAHYQYLRHVYDFYVELRERGEARKAARRIAESAGLKGLKRHAIRTIIEASSSNVDRRMVSRWTQALRFIWSRRRHWRIFETCLRQHGGIAGCAQALAEAERQRHRLGNVARQAVPRTKVKRNSPSRARRSCSRALGVGPSALRQWPISVPHTHGLAAMPGKAGAARTDQEMRISR
jgi:hypothetical protein